VIATERALRRQAALIARASETRLFIVLAAAAAAGVAGISVTRDHPTALSALVLLSLFAGLTALFGIIQGVVLLFSLALPAYEVGWFDLFHGSIGLFTLMVLTVVAVVVAAAPREWLLILRRRATWPVIAFAASVAFSLAVAPRTDLSTHLAKTYLGRALVLPLSLAVAVAALSRADAFRLLARIRVGVVLVALAGSILAILQIGTARGYLVPSNTTIYIEQFLGIRAIGLSEAPGTWGAFLLLPIAFLVSVLVRRPSLLGAAVLLMLFVGLAFSGLRSAWLAGGVVIIGLSLLAPGAWWRRLTPIALTVCSVLIALQFTNFRAFLNGAGSNEVHSSTTTSRGQQNPSLGRGRLGADESLRFRYDITRAELELGRRHPVAGVGLGNLGLALKELPASYRGAQKGLVPGVPIEKHNTYAGLFAELGSIGALTFLAVIASGFIVLTRLRRIVQGTPLEVELVDGLIGAFAATSIVAGFTEADRQVFLWWVLGLAIGLAAATQRRNPARASTR
jgi:hypothetical protein